MNTTYTFTLSNHNRKYYLRFAVLLLAVNYILYFMDAWNRVQNGYCTWWRCLLVPGLLVTALVVYGWQRPNRQTALLALFGYGTALWLFNGQYIAAAVLLVLGALFWLADRDFEFRFSTQGIIISTLPPRNYQWKDLQNVILKDGLLTIDRRDNKIFQLDVSAAAVPFTEEELNTFCTTQIQSAG